MLPTDAPAEAREASAPPSQSLPGGPAWEGSAAFPARPGRPWQGWSAALLTLLLAGCSGLLRGTVPAERWNATSIEAAVRQAVETTLQDCQPVRCGMRLDRSSRVDSLRYEAGRVRVWLNDAFAQVPFREAGLAWLRAEIEGRLDPTMPATAVDLMSFGLEAAELVPNRLRQAIPIDSARVPAAAPEPRPMVRRESPVPESTRGLFGRHIALWHSHGWYWERRLSRWEWQRARLFQTVEDIFPTAFVLPYVAPMLERAGATVWLPRERDLQTGLTVVDNDGSTGVSVYIENGPWQAIDSAGFAVSSRPLTDGENPFAAGTARSIESAADGAGSIEWRPSFERDGEYAVYVSYARHDRATPAARYEVRHAGGSTELTVDQRMAPGTWVYLGTFGFRAAAGADSASVRLTNAGPDGTVVTADAVRFGGGMGNVERGGTTSGRPRWAEAARYHLQYSGFPADLVYHVTGEVDDYRDDYRGRPEWVNYLRGAPNGPNKDLSAPGLGVPVDLSLAFHTDAGVTPDDSTIGTLLIYSSPGADTTRFFPDGMSRFANRDFADLLQTQVVDDIRALHDSTWSRRSLWDRDYSEAVRPNVPAALLELLSHQNFADMRFGLDPRFRFNVSRAIYKAMARFLAGQYGLPDPVIQPLAPTHLEARVVEPGRVRISWRAAVDPLEPSAKPDGYVVRVRKGTADFDGGRVVRGDSAWVPVEAGIDYAFRVSAWNEGGESAPSETVAAAWVPGRQNVLVVSAFDRLSAPARIDRGPWRGFLDEVDHGVADRVDFSFIGAQKEFDQAVPWRDDDDPGHGASYGDFETVVSAGNTFDYPAIHGVSILRAGFGYDTVSDERLLESGIPAGYRIVDLVLGEERGTTPGAAPTPEFEAFPPEMIAVLGDFADRRGSILVSGAYVGTELYETTSPPAPVAVQDPSTPPAATSDGVAAQRAAFARDVLHIVWRTGRAVRIGEVYSVDPGTEPAVLDFHMERNPSMYAAESPDALDPVGDGARPILRYRETNHGAGVAFAGAHRAITLGFPLETVRDQATRDRLFVSLLGFLFTN